MHASYSRVQNVFGFFTTVTFFVAILTALSVVLYPSTPSASVNIKKVKVFVGPQRAPSSSAADQELPSIRGRPQYTPGKTQEYAFVNLSLDADLSTLFNWNTKQVFVYLTVSYPGAPGTKHSDNEVTIWDAIVTEKKHARVRINNEKAKYQFNDISGKFLGRNATARFAWNVQPHVGALTWGSIEGGDVGTEEKGEAWAFRFPEVGSKTKKKADASA